MFCIIVSDSMIREVVQQFCLRQTKLLAVNLLAETKQSGFGSLGF